MTSPPPCSWRMPGCSWICSVSCSGPRSSSTLPWPSGVSSAFGRDLAMERGQVRLMPASGPSGRPRGVGQVERFALRSVRRMARRSPQVERRKRHGQSGPLLGGWRLATIPSPPRRPTMRYSNRRAFRDQLNFLRRQFLQDGDLPFTNVLTEGVIAQALATLTGWLDRIFSPLVTLWVFLGQVLSAAPSCRAAVARLITHRLAQGQRPCSAATGAYCQARRRLPESFFADVACQTGRALEADVDPRWLWKGRHVYRFDGTTVTMPDTRENQQAYPQVYNQKPGLGFPIARLGALISLACGAVVNLGFCQDAGKGQGEVRFLRRLWDSLRPGDILLTDALLANRANSVMLKG